MAEISTPKSKGEVNMFNSEEELAVSLAKHTVDLFEKNSKNRSSFSVVISGDSLVKSLRKLTEPPYIDSVEWSKWHVFWVDERVVPKDHPDSNYLLAFNEFLSKVPIPPDNIHAINDALSAEGGADDYEARLKHLIELKVIDQTKTNGFPKFDLMKPPPERISFTLPVINSSANVTLVVAGGSKATPVHAAIASSSNSEVLPVQLVSSEEA